MEAFAVAASVLQVATVGLALARVLYSLCDEAPSGNSHVENLAFSVKSTSSVLEDIGKVFQEEENTGQQLISQNAISTVNQIIKKCTDAFETLQSILSDTQQSVFGLVRFTLKTSAEAG
jgi:hypothetical protein